MKRGQIWISAVLYMALGVVALTIILAAGVPMVQKMKDKNSVTQTKNVFLLLDQNIRGVVNEGPGARRYISPLQLSAGEFYVTPDRLIWNMTTKAKLLEPGVVINEGAVEMRNYETFLEDEFVMNLQLNYVDIAVLQLSSEFSNPFVGVYSMSIEHTGEYQDSKPIVKISMTG
ncbi:hypothetical protein D6777_02025 [Candidatus Woesearchaeota archaeon]|nr:MAG: hypothetical protein D6777_02025 [Candidatus Woesearchaeota archaeon]